MQPARRRCITPGCIRRQELYSALCICCQLEGHEDPMVPAPRSPGRPETKSKAGWPDAVKDPHGEAVVSYLHLGRDAALLVCELGHDHIVGSRQMQIVDTPCPWDGTALRVVRLGWQEGAA